MDPIGEIFFSRVSHSVPFSKKKDPRRGGGPITDENNPIFFPEVDNMITAHEKREADAAAGAAEENGEGEINNDAAKRRKTTRDL